MTYFKGLTSVRSWVLLAVGALAFGVAVNVAVDRGTARRTARGCAGQATPGVERLEGEMHTVQARIQAKADIADKVVAGQMTLLEAAACFLALDRMPPCCPELRCRSMFPGALEEELCLRAVILWAQTAVKQSEPCLAAAIGAQLEDQLTEYLRRSPLPLPEVDVDSLLQSREID